MSKSLLVLAASIYQVPVIEAARRLGYRVLTTDNRPDNPGHALAHSSFNIDTKDHEGVLALAKTEGIAGIIAPATDIAVPTGAYVAGHLGLPGPPLKAAHVLTDKFCFREFLRGANLACPAAIRITQHSLPDEAFFDGRTFIVKPNRSSGSKGIFIIRSLAELNEHLSESLAFSMDSTALLEEFIEGTQHTCEGVLEGGQVAAFLLTDRDTASRPYTATTGHRVPSLLPTSLQKKALRVIEEVFERLGIANGPFDCDFVVDGEHIVLIEMTARLGGNSLSSLFQSALNFDLVSYAIRYACQDPYAAPEIRSPQARAIAILGVDRPGKLAWNAREEEKLRHESWVEHMSIDFPQGASIRAFIHGRERAGEVLIRGANRQEIDSRLAEFKRRLDLRVM